MVVVEFNPFTPVLQSGEGACFVFLNMWALSRLWSVRIVSRPQPAVQTPSASLRLQALVYDILPSTTAVFSYAIGSRKLSASEQFFVGAQTVVSLLQITQITSDVCFITDHVAYASSNKTKIV